MNKGKMALDKTVNDAAKGIHAYLRIDEDRAEAIHSHVVDVCDEAVEGAIKQSKDSIKNVGVINVGKAIVDASQICETPAELAYAVFSTQTMLRRMIADYKDPLSKLKRLFEALTDEIINDDNSPKRKRKAASSTKHN